MSKFILPLVLLAAVGGAFAADEKGEKGEKQKGEIVTMDQLPAPVQTALKAAAGTSTIKEIEKASKHGKTVYEAEFVGADGKTKQVKFDETGKEIVKGEHKGEKGEKGEKAEGEHHDGK